MCVVGGSMVEPLAAEENGIWLGAGGWVGKILVVN